MKKTVFIFAIFLCGLGSAFAQDTEKAAVRLPLENYIKGHETGDGEYMKKAFHTEGNLIFIRDGKYTTRSFAEYIAGFSGKPAMAKWSVEHIAGAWNALMLALGYDRYFAQGGDWGSAVTCAIGVAHGDHCAGIHVNMVVGAPPPEMMNELSDTENRIAVSRQVYNDTVLTYNNKVQQVPTNFVASIFGFDAREFFEAGEEADQAPAVEF